MAMFSTVSNWLRGNKSKKRRFADMAEFRQHVIVALNKRPGVNAVANTSNPAAIEIRIGDWSAAGDVTNIFGHLRAYPDEDADNTIERFVRSCLERKPAALDEQTIVAVIRSREY